jgi:UPF0755 protein
VTQQVSDLGLDLEPGRRRARRRRRPFGCLAVLIALAVLVGGGYLAVSYGVDALQSRLSPPEDYEGSGTGRVLVEVRQGEAASDIAATLVDQGVVKSQEAFTDAARNDPDSVTIQVGFYELKKQMSAESALAVLVQPENRVRNTVTIPEGYTVRQIVAALAKKTDFPARQFDRVLADPTTIGLPTYAEGNPEGYLFPATYELPPTATPRSILTSMVKRYKAAVTDLDVSAKAQGLGYTPHDVMTVASLVQSEARNAADFPRVARVVYNRLDQDMPLQFDSTVHYATGKDGSVGTSDDARSSSSPYNTYKVTGLPPTPIAAPGEQAIRAALNPAPGSWLYFVTTNPDTGETKFATSFAGHQRNVRDFEQWCADSDKC